MAGNAGGAKAGGGKPMAQMPVRPTGNTLTAAPGASPQGKGSKMGGGVPQPTALPPQAAPPVPQGNQYGAQNALLHQQMDALETAQLARGMPSGFTGSAAANAPSTYTAAMPAAYGPAGPTGSLFTDAGGNASSYAPPSVPLTPAATPTPTAPGGTAPDNMAARQMQMDRMMQMRDQRNQLNALRSGIGGLGKMGGGKPYGGGYGSGFNPTTDLPGSGQRGMDQAYRDFTNQQGAARQNLDRISQMLGLGRQQELYSALRGGGFNNGGIVALAGGGMLGAPVSRGGVSYAPIPTRAAPVAAAPVAAAVAAPAVASTGPKIAWTPGAAAPAGGGGSMFGNASNVAAVTATPRYVPPAFTPKQPVAAATSKDGQGWKGDPLFYNLFGIPLPKGALQQMTDRQYIDYKMQNQKMGAGSPYRAQPKAGGGR